MSVVQDAAHFFELARRVSSVLELIAEFIDFVFSASMTTDLVAERPGFGSADPVGILADDLVAALLSHLSEVIELGLGMLIDGKHSYVQGGALHREDHRNAYI